jgi:hypothetical protein
VHGGDYPGGLGRPCRRNVHARVLNSASASVFWLSAKQRDVVDDVGMHAGDASPWPRNKEIAPIYTPTNNSITAGGATLTGNTGGVYCPLGIALARIWERTIPVSAFPESAE